MSALFYVNLAALVAMIAALITAVLRPTWHDTEEGRAVVVLMAAVTMLAFVGMLRRLEFGNQETLALISWTVVLAVGVWAILRR